MMNRRPDPDGFAEHAAIPIAEALREDFIALIAVFDRQGACESPSASMSAGNISEARIAAERGLRLSDELVELLRKSS